jgi:hypothetical protein
VNPQNLISSTVALCLLIAAVGGVGGAIYVCRARAVDCLEGWKAAGAGALAAAGLGGTLLARLPGIKPGPEELGDPPRGDGGRG